MQAFLQPTLLFLTSLAHHSMSGTPGGVYNANPYAVMAPNMYQAPRSYAPAFMPSRYPFRRPLRMRQPPVMQQQYYYDQQQAYYRPNRPYYDAPVNPYAAYYGGGGSHAAAQAAQVAQVAQMAQMGQLGQVVLVGADAAQQAYGQRQIFVLVQPHQAYGQAPQNQHQQNQVVSRAVPVPQPQMMPHQPSVMSAHQQADPNAFTVGSSYSFQTQDMGKQISHGKK